MNDIDKLVAKHLNVESCFMDGSVYPQEHFLITKADGQTYQYPRFEPSTYFEDATIIIDYLREHDKELGVHLSFYHDRFMATWSRFCVQAETPAMAICLMFMKSLGVEVERR